MFHLYRNLFRNVLLYKPFRITTNYNFYTLSNRAKLRLYKTEKNCRIFKKNSITANLIICTSLLTWLGFSKEDQAEESVLIKTIKRSILLMQRGELPKAERMLHIALRLAQNQRNPKGIIYVYDLMANLALEREEFDKAEKLFVNVLQRLLSSGVTQDDIKAIHISLKLARICHMKGELDKAEIGFKWCLESIKKDPENYDSRILSGVINDWYAKLLVDKGKYQECLPLLEEAYKINSEIEGSDNEKSIMLLNDIGTANWHSGDFDNAQKYLNLAISLSKKLDNFDHLGILYANLGLIRLQQGILSDAQKYCKEGWRLGKKQNNNDAIEQANYCFEQIKSHT